MESKSHVYRFDDVEVREREFSLVKAGKEVTVEPKAFRTLLLLLRNPQKLITKEELLNTVWGDTAVTDGSLTRCIWLLRRLLGDDINEPRYIATVATVGYRFICAVEATEEPAGAVDAPIQAPEKNEAKSKATRPRIQLAVAAIAVILACGVLLVGWWRTPIAVPAVESVTQLTDDPLRKSNLVTDGSRIYFNEGMEGSSRIAQVSIEGGPSVPLQTGLPDPIPTAAARDGTALLGINMSPGGFSSPLWSIPLPAGEPRRLGNVMVQSADMFPDNRILYSAGKDVLIAENDGSNPRKLASLAGIVRNIVVSPDGKRVLFQVDARGDLKYDTFEMLADGTVVREIRKANANECCFGWSWDGKYLLYSARTGKRWDLWALPVRAGILRRSEIPVRLTNGPISFWQGGLPSRDGKQIFAIGSKERGQLVRYDIKSSQFVPLLSGISATDATYSIDGNWVAYIMFPEHTLWRSRSDGSERMQLTYPPMEVWEPFISPDGTKIAFDSIGDNSVCVIDVNGGSPRTISASANSPRWSPDGNSVVYNRVKADGGEGDLEMAEVGTGKKTEIPSPDGKLGAFWLDQQTMVAANGDLKKLMIFDFRTRTWTDLVAATLENWINSPDGKYAYYAAGGTEASIQRIRIADRHVETVTSLKDFTRVSNYEGPQLRMAADGSPSLTRAIDNEEIYALNVRWPR
jgi:DNA-binding winged helix-turn-helix (wHTH) protein/Tol biopolymer transport system component